MQRSASFRFSVSYVIKLLLLAAALELTPKYAVADATAVVHPRYGKRDIDFYDEAIADATRAIKLNPKDDAAYNVRGVNKVMGGNHKGAISDYDQAIALNPKCNVYYHNRAMSKQETGDLTGAIADYSHAIELAPRDGDEFIYRGTAKQDAGDLHGAIADCTRALELWPRDLYAYDVRSIARYLNRDWPGALADFKKYCDISKGDELYAHLFIWIIQTRLGEKSAANGGLAIYAAKLSDQEEWSRGLTGYLLGKVPEAEVLRAASNSGMRCQAWFYIGMKKLLDGDKAAAAKDFKKCLATRRDNYGEYKCAKVELEGSAS